MFVFGRRKILRDLKVDWRQRVVFIVGRNRRETQTDKNLIHPRQFAIEIQISDQCRRYMLRVQDEPTDKYERWSTAKTTTPFVTHRHCFDFRYGTVTVRLRQNVLTEQYRRVGKHFQVHRYRTRVCGSDYEMRDVRRRQRSLSNFCSSGFPTK